jgi:hypothetical protein
VRWLVCGDRNWDDRKTMLRVLKRIAVRRSKYKGIERLIEGEAPGADWMSRDIFEHELRDYNWVIDPHPAQWKRFGRAAGPIRNQEMLEAKPDRVLAFHNDLAHSKGTRDMVQRAHLAGIPVRVIKGGRHG